MFLRDFNVFQHLDHDPRNILIHHIHDITLNRFGCNGIELIPTQLMLTVVHFRSFNGGTNATRTHFGADDCCIDKTILFSDIKPSGLADNAFEPFKVKIFSIVLVEEDNNAF